MDGSDPGARILTYAATTTTGTAERPVRLRARRLRAIAGLSRRIPMAVALLLLAAAVSWTGCRKTWEAKTSAREWSRSELRNLQGKTRDEIRDQLGEPRGMYTYDARGRWHFPHVLVREEGEPKAQTMSVLVYFSQTGEERATIIEVLDRWEREKE